MVERLTVNAAAAEISKCLIAENGTAFGDFGQVGPAKTYLARDNARVLISSAGPEIYLYDGLGMSPNIIVRSAANLSEQQMLLLLKCANGN